MKIKLFADWNERKILKEKEFEEEIAECAKARENDDYEFEDFLDNYCDRNLHNSNRLAHLFNLSKEEREKILELWKEDCLETVRNNSDDDYEEIEIEL